MTRSAGPRPGAGSAALSTIDVAGLDSPVRAFLEGNGITEVLVFDTPMTIRFRGITRRNGLLLRGPQGWGECAPFWDYDARESSPWLASAIAAATVAAPAPLSDRVPVNVTIPVEPADAAAARAARSGCLTAKVKVADPRSTLAEDIDRVSAVADALRSTSGGAPVHVRVDVNGAWDVETAVASIPQLDAAAAAVGGLEYVEQPCATVSELAVVRRAVDVPIAADESIRRAEDPLLVARAGAADVAVIKVAPLGGIDRALEVAHDSGLDTVISSALDSAVGIGAGLAAAAALTTRACGLATGALLAGDVADAHVVEHGTIRLSRPEPRTSGPTVSPYLVQAWIHRLHRIVEVSCGLAR